MCEASSWRGTTRQRQPYGPGGYNRCVLSGEHPQRPILGGTTDIHIDDFGNRFVLEPSFRVLNRDDTPKAGR